MDMGMKFEDMGMTFDDMGMRFNKQTSSKSTLKQSKDFATEEELGHILKNKRISIRGQSCCN